MTKAEQKTLDLLKADGKLTHSDLSEKISVDERTIRRGLKKLKENGLIERIGSDKLGEWKVIT